MKKRIALFLCTVAMWGLTACNNSTQSVSEASKTETATSAAQEAVTTESKKATETEQYETPEITIVLAENDNETTVSSRAIAMFCQLVDERSHGRIKIEPYYGGQLGNEAENIENLRTGIVGITRINVANMENRGIDVPEYTLFGLPYLIRDEEHAKKFLDSDDSHQLAERISTATNGQIVSLDSYIVASPRHFFSKNPITSMADMSGMKVRSETTELKIDTMEAFGLSATPLPLNDMYSSLQTGMIDGGEHNLANIKSYAFYEQCPYVLLTGHSYNVNVFLVSGAVWTTLSQEDKDLIQTALQEASAWGTEQFVIETDSLQKELEAKGVTFTEPIDMENWQNAAQPLYDKYGSGYESFIETVLSYAE